MTLTLYNPMLSDVSDRIAREIGVIGVKSAFDTSNRKPRANAYDQLNMNYVPWWVRAPAGRVVLLDDIEGALNWITMAGTITRDQTAGRIHSGGYCIKLVTGNAAGNPAAVERCLEPLCEEDAYICIGVYWSLAAAAVLTARSFDLTLMIYDGTNYYTAMLRYLVNLAGAQRKWQYINNVGAWVDIGGAAMPYNTTMIQQRYTMLVLRWTAAAKLQYYQLRDGLKDYDLGLAAVQVVADGNYMTLLDVGFTTDLAAASTGYLDDIFVVVTQDPTQI